MFTRKMLFLVVSACAWAQTPYKGELSLSQVKRVIEGGSPSIYGEGRATSLGAGASLILNPANTLRLRYEKSIAVSSLPPYDPFKGSVRRDKDFQSLSFAYLHWFSSETAGGWFFGPSVSLNQVKQDSNAPIPTESTGTSARVAIVSGYQFGKHVGFELHAGIPWSSASLVYRF